VTALLELGKKLEVANSSPCPRKANKEERKLSRKPREYFRSPNLICYLMLAGRTVPSLPASRQDSTSSARNNRCNSLLERPTPLACHIVDPLAYLSAARGTRQPPQQLLRSTGTASQKYATGETFHEQVCLFILYALLLFRLDSEVN